ncbi:MAG TPA: class I SAM-dependent methyltransferase [Candidatus Sulfopaludibacter sp.]|jgi:SAM-dependent methyltransferase|nr:class I SAM-dependent methyltransferase [Candidatus Sulfopaludibacter sp.]
MQTDPTHRFTDRADVYALHRPSYPPELTALLQTECGLTAGSTIADIGCGTGLLAELFLKAGCEVFGVEPNGEMRNSGARQLAAWPRFHPIDGRAEATTLPDASVDFVTAGQAFHWFDPADARAEFVRILKPSGRIVLVWNERAVGDGFQAAYDEIVRRYAPEITRIQHDAIDVVFGGSPWRLVEFENRQVFDLAGLQGRLASSSYAPARGTAAYQEMLDALSALFDAYQTNGRVTLLYDTKLYL